MSLEGRTVVVIGVGPGLGAEVARLALRDGANVVAAARSGDRLEEVAGELDPSGDRVLALPTDITDDEAVTQLVAAGLERYGRIDALVPVAAYDSLIAGVTGTSDDQWHDVLDVNLVAAVGAVRVAADAMADGGAVTFIGTQSMVRPGMPMLAYAASKGGLQAAMYQLVRELGPRRIRINMVVPTWMWGQMVEGFLDRRAAKLGVDRQALIDEITATMPLGEMPTDADVAEAIVWLCSDRARMVTGQTLYVNAGEYLH